MTQFKKKKVQQYRYQASYLMKQKFKPRSVIHTSSKIKQLIHIYAKDDNEEKKRVQHCIETDLLKITVCTGKEEAVQLTNRIS